ncbi:hypothetical protein D3Z36_07795 [Lachnospiraceae bacterium]|nr:hypothetical protein [Lachnospiraceae bacterium]
MDIKTMRSFLTQFQETLLVKKEMVLSGERILVAGICLEEETLKLYLFAEGKDRSAYFKNLERMERKRKKGTLTRREEILGQLEEGQNEIFDILPEIRINGKLYEFSSGTSGNLEEYDEWGRILLMNLLLHQAEFGFLEERELSLIAYHILEFAGKYDRIPFTKEDLQTLEFIHKPKNYHVPVKRKMTLKLGEQKGGRQSFFCEKTGKRVEFFINSVKLVDLQKEIYQKSEELLRRGRMSGEQAEEYREHMKKLCPADKRLIVVAYECGEAFLEFYTREELLETVKPVCCAESYFLLGRFADGSGMHGKELKTALIYQPVEPDIKEVELELLCAFVRGEEI